VLHHVLDRFLGRHHLGSLAINQILPGGREQLTHTDYPPGFYTMEDMASVFTSRALETVMPYFSLQAGIALCDMDSHNGATATIPYSHALRNSDWRIAGAKPKPGEPLPAEQELNRSFFDSVQPLLVQAGVRKGGAIMFNSHCCSGKSFIKGALTTLPSPAPRCCCRQSCPSV